MNVRRWRAPLVWGVLILILTSIPVPAIGAPAGSDKGVHVILYLVLGLLAGQALFTGQSPRVSQLLVLVASLIAFGAIDEVHQAWIPGRTADPRDLVADGLGAMAGVCLAIGLARARARRAL